MKLAIIGQGAIGSLFAYYLKPLSPTILSRRQLDEQQMPVTLIELDSSKRVIEAEIVSIDNIQQSKFDALLICVKHYHLDDLLSQLPNKIDENSCLILIQNGMGGSEMLQRHFASNPIIVGTTTDAVYGVNEYTFNISAKGQLQLGISQCKSEQQKNCNIILDIFEKYHPNAKRAPDIQRVLYEKLAINAVINPLTGVLNVKNGELVNFAIQLEAMIQEVFSVYEANGLAFEKQYLTEKIMKVISLTANNVSSMLQDIRLNRQTEIDGVLGYLIQMNVNKKTDIPTIRSYYNQVKALEGKKNSG